MDSKVFGYMRVSTKEQNTDRQETAIKEYCQANNIELNERDIFVDKASGKDFEREEYKALKRMLRAGDTLIVKELDRLGRNMQGIKEEWQDLTTKGINLVVIDTSILNTNNKTDLEKNLISNIVFELLAYMGEREREKIKQRQTEGIAELKARNGGKGIGRPALILNTLSAEQMVILNENYSKIKSKELSNVKLMELLGLKKNSYYKIIKEFEQEKV